MSTRRARIKAVATLPVRRRGAENKTNTNENKNNENKNNVSKESQDDELSENVVRDKEISDATKNSASDKTDNKSSDEIDSIENNNNANNVPKESNHRRRMMRPSINIASSNKRSKVPDKKETPKASSQETKHSLSPIKSPKSLKSPMERHLKLLNNNSKKNSNIIQKNTPKIDIKSPKNKSDNNEKLNNILIDDIVPAVSESDEISNMLIESNDPVNSGLEYRFDPIIPLPSPTKNRPKLKPTPWLSIRRNSCQGSASESEDDTKKSKRDEMPVQNVQNNTPQTPLPLNVPARIRNDSVCSLPSDSHLHVNLPMTPRQKVYRPRPNGGECRRAIAKKKALNKLPQNPLTMCDLIYYNPPNNKKSENNMKKNQKICIAKIEEPNLSNKEEEKSEIQHKTEEVNNLAVPQVKLGPNGEIIVDEQSLVIETTDSLRSKSEISKLSIVYENANTSFNGLYRRASRSHEWTNTETLRFYKALNTIGTDFALMLSLFPGRTRRDLKMKFKKEEKQNISLVDKALLNPINFDITELEAELLEEQKAAELAKKKEAQLKNKNLKTKQSKPLVNYRKSSAALRSMDECIINMDEPAIKKRKVNTKTNMEINSQFDKITEILPENTNDSLKENENCNEKLPENIEPGSMVVIVKKIPGKPGRNTLQAYVVSSVGNENNMVPITLDLTVLKSIAQDMNILRDDQEYELASEEITPDASLENSGEINSDDTLINTDGIDIDDNILNDSMMDNYILTGKTPNIIKLSNPLDNDNI